MRILRDPKSRAFRKIGMVLVAMAMIMGPLVLQGDAEEMQTIRDKTIVAWVYLANTSQQGGGVLTLDDGNSNFDAVVFGEIAAGKWMAGSEHLSRSQRDQDKSPWEEAKPETCVQIAVTYRGKEISIYRNGELYTRYTIDKPRQFGPGTVAVMGLRHLDAGDRACFAGAIEDARIYPIALTQKQIADLKPNIILNPQPIAWWAFRDGQIGDRMGTFPETLLVGSAGVHEGKLLLDGKESYLVAAPKGSSSAWLKSAPQGDDTDRVVRQHRANLLADPQRPAYHFVAPEGRCMPFDPNGAIYWKGKYHLCYIFQDERGHCWGHASSADLVHWRFLPPALFPSPGDVDTGIFSGNCFINLKGEATMLYHGVGAGNCIATSAEDDLVKWTKLPSNPIVPNPKEGSPEFKVYSSWDPHGWVEGDTYYAIFGGQPGAGTVATLFKSKDMDNWEYVGPFLANDMPGIAADDDISCPDFFKIGNKHMLLCISHKRGCRYYLGRWENEKFYPESHAWMNGPGGTFFAPESLVDSQGRRIMWAWVLDWRPGMEPPSSGWSGTMSLPRHLWLGDDGILHMAPVKELESLRFNPRRKENIALTAGSELVLDDVRGDCLELALEIQPGQAKEVGVKIRRSPNGEEETPVLYDSVAGTLRVELAKSSEKPYLQHLEFIMGGPNGPVTKQEAPLVLASGEPLRLRIFIDRSIIEIFANERQAITQRIDPSRNDSLGISLISNGGDAAVTALDAWDMAPANQW